MKTNTTLKIVAICVICAATLMGGCVETTEPAHHHEGQTSNSLTTEHVSGIDVVTTLNNVDTLHVSGVDNTVYIPSPSTPMISQSGVGCKIIRR